MSIESTLPRRTVSGPKVGPKKEFVRLILPWLMGGGMLCVYLATLNHWVSLGSLQQVASLSGFSPDLDLDLDLYAPVTFLLTLPLRWIPAGLVPVGLNLFNAFCAALALAFLARSVALLPHDRTHEQREKERSPFWLLSIPSAWLAPVTAVLVCGLELTYWEFATNGKGDQVFPGTLGMLNLTLFAYVIRCLLEFRISQKESWLYRAAFIFAASIANNWGAIGFLPLFLVALIWIRGLAFFNLQFLGRFFLFGLAGLAFYLVLPLHQAFSQIAHVGFWQALRVNLGGQHWILSVLFTKYNLFHSDKPLWVLGLYSLLPILAISVRWPSYFGDTSKLGVAIATLTTHLVHGLLLVLCGWIMLDPQISPRNHGLGLPLLTLYYLCALSLGYLVGYFLLIFRPDPSSTRNTNLLLRVLKRVVPLCVWLVCLALPMLLISRNLSIIRGMNGPALKQFTRLLATGIPDTQTAVLSEDNLRLNLLQSFTAGTPAARKIIFIDTNPSVFKLPGYHRFLKRKYPQRWPISPTKEAQNPFDPIHQTMLLDVLAATNALYYLHPSFGYFFEVFTPEAHGMLYKLSLAQTNSMLSPVPDPQLLEENRKFWKETQATLFPAILQEVTIPDSRKPVGLRAKIFKAIHIQKENNRETAALARFLSRSLVYWGVELQRTSKLKEAQAFFESALQLNPENLVATVNLKCNRDLQKGMTSKVRDPHAVLDEFGRYRNWDDLMNENGPFDEPTFCFAEGLALAGNSLYRQAINQFDRVKTLAPDHLPSRLQLAGLYLARKLPAEALKNLEEIRAHPDLLPINQANERDMVYLEGSTRLALGQPDEAQRLVQAALQKYPEDQELLGTAVRMYMDNALPQNALPLIERQIQRDPTNPNISFNLGYAHLQSGHYAEAIPIFTQVLERETNTTELYYTALLNRAIAYLKNNQLNEAQKDYEALQKSFPTAFRLYYGLGEIAYRRRDTNAALRNYQLYLTNAPTNPDEIKQVTERMKELKPGYP